MLWPVHRLLARHVLLAAFDEVALIIAPKTLQEPAATCSQMDAAAICCFVWSLWLLLVRAVDHHRIGQLVLDEPGADLGHVLGVEVRRREPPRRMTWQLSLPVVWKMADTPCFVTDGNQWGDRAASTASTAVWVFPSVPFLKLTGIDNPDASSRWTGLWVVWVPMATHDVKVLGGCAAESARRGTQTRSAARAR